MGTSKRMNYLEYKVDEFEDLETISSTILEKYLNDMGENNWELTTLIGKKLVFKRTMEQTLHYE